MPEIVSKSPEMSFSNSPTDAAGFGVKKRPASINQYERNSIVKNPDVSKGVDLDFSEIEIMIQEEMSKD